MDEPDRDYVVMRLDDARRAMEDARNVLLVSDDSADVRLLASYIGTQVELVESGKARAEKL